MSGVIINVRVRVGIGLSESLTPLTRSSPGHVSFRPALRAHGAPRASRRLRAGRRRAVHGADDAAGLVVRLHHGGCDHAAVGHARQGQGQDQVRCAQGESSDVDVLTPPHSTAKSII